MINSMIGSANSWFTTPPLKMRWGKELKEPCMESHAVSDVEMDGRCIVHQYSFPECAHKVMEHSISLWMTR